MHTQPSLNVHVSAPEREDCIVEPPVDWVWKLEQQLQEGRQNAPGCSEISNEIIIENVGFTRCAEVPHLYHRVKEQVSLEVHVDDFYAVVPGTAPERLLKQIGEHLTQLVEGPYNEGNHRILLSHTLSDDAR